MIQTSRRQAHPPGFRRVLDVEQHVCEVAMRQAAMQKLPVMEAALETGQDVGRIAEAAIKSAIKAAGRVGSKSARTVRDVLAGVVRGIDDVVGAATDKRSTVRKRKVAVAKKAGAAVRKVAKAPAKLRSTTAVKRAAKTAAKKQPVRDRR